MTTYVDGKAIAEKIQLELKEYTRMLDTPLSFHIIYVGSDPVIDNFIRYKKKFGEAIGVQVVVHHIDEAIDEESLIVEIQNIQVQADAVIIQLPLPDYMNTQNVLDTIDPKKDVDVLGTASRRNFSLNQSIFFPPVTGSIVSIFDYHKVDLNDKKIVLLGNGLLVGYPMSLWLEREGYEYSVIEKETEQEIALRLLGEADVIITGIGVPHMLASSMVKDKVIVIDAGTSEAGRKIEGDVDPSVSEKASLITPVPGGIGPITIAVLYQNIINTHKKNQNELSR